ncbi:metallophosphoesterase [Streptomyces sp. 71268]|uniref:metallophosphoesterase n=1 Tax=Streptomyces sp. 71268 TaxID=3002640 RepID=UPI0023FA061D|nr:metallophosphoesterase [Streptomyces sp. 71268]WEV27326.1 metallophosphoesterase [Streptomyces sp. 71268]
MVAVFALVALLIVALLGGVHWYVWRRMVRDVTAAGGWPRRVGTWAVVALPLLSVGALVSGRAGAPFTVQRVLAWPGYMWLATLLYLTLALIVGEAVRPLLLRALERRARRAPTTPPTTTTASTTTASAGPPATATPATETVTASTPVATTTARPTAPATTTTSGAPTTAATPAPSGTATGPANATNSANATASPDATVAAAIPDRATTLAPDGVTATAPATTRPQATASGATDAPTPDRTPTSDEATPNGVTPDGATPDEANSDQALSDQATSDQAAPAAAQTSRRLFVARTVAAGAGAVAAATVGYGTYSVFRGPRVKRITVPLAKLSRQAHGYRIAVVSDIHLGPILGRAHTQRVVETINRVNPDLVAVVGDLVDGSVADLGPAAEPLRHLRARDGSFFVTGNHEYFSGADAWVDHVRELGLRPLENERTELPGFDLAGVNDVAGEDEGKGPDFRQALGDRDRGRAAVLLAHQPVVIYDAVRHGVDLQLSGHTHGGQLWPGNYLAELANPTVAGLERYGDTQLYVSRGAGAWGPPVRVGAPPDITVVQLASPHA